MNDWGELTELYHLYCSNDSHATSKLFVALEGILIGFYRNRGLSEFDSEDLCQGTLLKIHLARMSFDPKRSLKTWIFRIARNMMLDHWRGKEEAIEIPIDPDSSEDDSGLNLPDPRTNLESISQLNQDLSKALTILKPNERSIVFLSVMQGCSMAEIGEILGLSEAATKVRAHRAYVELRTHLKAGAYSLLCLILEGLLK